MEANRILSELSFVQVRKNVQIVVYHAVKGCYSYSNYPINILRNVGISLVRTTHFIMLDMDAWPASSRLFLNLSEENVEEEMDRIPDFILRDPDSVIILPIFFFNQYYIRVEKCRTIQGCTFM